MPFDAVAWRVAVAPLTHPDDIVERICAPCHEPMELPFAMKSLWAATRVMTADHHRAFAAPTRTPVDGIAESLRRPIRHGATSSIEMRADHHCARDQDCGARKTIHQKTQSASVRKRGRLKRAKSWSSNGRRACSNGWHCSELALGRARALVHKHPAQTRGGLESRYLIEVL